MIKRIIPKRIGEKRFHRYFDFYKLSFEQQLCLLKQGFRGESKYDRSIIRSRIDNRTIVFRDIEYMVKEYGKEKAIDTYIWLINNRVARTPSDIDMAPCVMNVFTPNEIVNIYKRVNDQYIIPRDELCSDLYRECEEFKKYMREYLKKTNQEAEYEIYL